MMSVFLTWRLELNIVSYTNNELLFIALLYFVSIPNMLQEASVIHYKINDVIHIDLLYNANHLTCVTFWQIKLMRAKCYIIMHILLICITEIESLIIQIMRT